MSHVLIHSTEIHVFIKGQGFSYAALWLCQYRKLNLQSSKHSNKDFHAYL